MKLTITDCSYLNTSKIVKDYLNGNKVIGDFFAYSSFTMEQLKKHSEKLLRGKFNSNNRTQLVKALLAYNNSLGCSEAVEKNIRKLENHHCQVVVTGQQAALLSGASFVIYKAISAILLALKLEQETGQPVVPVFWIASEDHDFLEVNNFSIYNQGKIIKYKIDNPLPGMTSIGKIPVTHQVAKIVEQLSSVLGKDQFTVTILEKVTCLAKSADNLADLYGSIMTTLFNDYGLIMCNPMQLELRQLAMPIGKKVFALSQTNEIAALVAESQQQLSELGYQPVFTDQFTDQIPMFYEVNGQREPMYLKDGICYVGRKNPMTIDLKEIQQMYETNPGQFSFNVLLRPVVQDYLFPTIAYVAGPGEINYLAQLKNIYQLFQVDMPVIFPRARVTMIGHEDYEQLLQNNLSFPVSRTEMGQWKNSTLKSWDKENFFNQISNKQNKIAQEYNQLLTAIVAKYPQLEEISDKNMNKINYQLNYIWDKTWQQHKKLHQKKLKKVQDLYALLHPQGKEQEMVLNIFSLLSIFGGKNLLQQLMKPKLIENTAKHKLVIIGGGSNGTS